MSPRAAVLLDEVEAGRMRLRDLGVLLRDQNDPDAEQALEEHFRRQFEADARRGEHPDMRAYLSRQHDEPGDDAIRVHLVDCDACHATMTAILVADAEAEFAGPALEDRAQEALCVGIAVAVAVTELARDVVVTAWEVGATAWTIGKFIWRIK